MKSLNLAWNGFSDDGSASLAIAIRNCTLTHLDLSSNRVGTSGFVQLIQAVKDSEYLRQLIVSVTSCFKSHDMYPTEDIHPS